MKKTILSIITGILAAFLIMQVVQPTIVCGNSMNPYLKNGDFLLLSKICKTPQRGDVLVFMHENRVLIKRVIGLPKETISYSQNNIYINGNLYEENYIDCLTDPGADVVLQEDEYYVLGDNRSASRDSREIGPINKKDIKGIIFFRLYTKLGKI